MTNEEAITLLKLDIEDSKNNIPYCHDEVGIEALELAIKALEQQQNIHDTCKKCVEFSEFEQQPCEDCISRAEVLKLIDYINFRDFSSYENLIVKINDLPSVTPKTGWIPIKTRPMTEEEKEHFSEYADSRCDDAYTMLDCPLPDDGQEVILSVNGYVSTDIFCRDSADGCYFESYDIDDVDAWMPLPEPYKGGDLE